MTIPLLYKLFFLYIEPISALAGAYYAYFYPSAYLYDLYPHPPSAGAILPPTSTKMSLEQLANLYLLFALNEHLVLSSTTSIKTWKKLLLCLLIADFGHLWTMRDAGMDVYWDVGSWNAMAWGSVGFVYMGATMRLAFLRGIGLGEGGAKGKGKVS